MPILRGYSPPVRWCFLYRLFGRGGASSRTAGQGVQIDTDTTIITSTAGILDDRSGCEGINREVVVSADLRPTGYAIVITGFAVAWLLRALL